MVLVEEYIQNYTIKGFRALLYIPYFPECLGFICCATIIPCKSYSSKNLKNFGEKIVPPGLLKLIFEMSERHSVACSSLRRHNTDTILPFLERHTQKTQNVL